MEDWLKSGRSTPGLVILRTVSRYFATGRASDALYNLKDLERVQLKGGNLEGFQNTWYMVINGMKKVPDIEMQELILYDAIKDQRELAEDIAHYHRLGEESKHEDRSFDYLLNCVNRLIRVKRHDVNKKALSQGIGGRPAALAPKKNGKDKGGGKGKNTSDTS